MKQKYPRHLLKTIFAFSLSIFWMGATSQIDFQRVVIDPHGPLDPFGKTIGDMDGDGLLDLVVGSFSGEGLHWYKNPGIPFARWEKYLIGEGDSFNTEYESADINQDGLPDLVVLYEAGIAWYKNPGAPKNGKWANNPIDTTKLHDIEVTDYDSDGDIDIVGRNQSEWDNDGNILHFYEQVNPNTWKHTTRHCSHGEGLLMADMNGNGKKDIVTGNKWYRNPGTMNGEDWVEFTLSSEWTHESVFLSTGDMNGDGLDDLVLAPSEPLNTTCRISWFERPRNPEKKWTEHIVDKEVQSDYHFVGCGDFDLDGNMDIVTAEMHHGKDPHEVAIYTNDKTGKCWKKNILWDKGSHSCRVFDCDNDGDLDFFGANYRGDEVNLWVNQMIQPKPLSLNKWTYLQIDSLRDKKAFGLATGDFNTDRFCDIASGNWVYFNPGNTKNAKWDRKTFPFNVDVLLHTEVDDDHHTDLIAQDGEGNIYWVEMIDNAGDEWYSKIIGNVGKSNHHLSSQGYCQAQLEPGGKTEIVIVGGEQPEGAIYYFTIPENPVNVMWPRKTVASSVYPEGIGFADFDQDGDIDLFGTSETNTTISWYENPSSGSQNWNRHPVGELKGADRFVAADINGDTRIDMVVSGANQDGNGIYWFQSPAASLTNLWTKNIVENSGKENSVNSLDVADMDGDGDHDIISATHYGNLEVAVWENDGRGHFIKHIVDTGKESHLGAKATDIDGDGDLDIISIGWNNSEYLHVWLNMAIQSK